MEANSPDTFFPVLNICDGSRIAAQSWTYEGDSYWLNDVTVTGNAPNNRICPFCEQFMDDFHQCPSYFETEHYSDSNVYLYGDGYGDGYGNGYGNGNAGSLKWRDLPNVTVTGNRDKNDHSFWSIELYPGGASTSDFRLPEITTIPDPTDKDKDKDKEDPKKKRAKDLIKKLLDAIKSSVFRNLNKDSFGRDLEDLVDEPCRANQGWVNGTCGAAVVEKWLLETNPELFVRTAISLYEKGYATVGGKVFNLPKSSYTGTDMKLLEMNMTGPDALFQGAMINSENLILDYNPFTDGSGIRSFATPGSVKDMITRFGGSCEYILPGSKDDLTYDQLSSIDYDNNFVIGLVYSPKGHSDWNFGSSSTSIQPDHYVQLKSATYNSVDYWTWGDCVDRTSTTNLKGFDTKVWMGLKIKK